MTGNTQSAFDQFLAHLASFPGLHVDDQRDVEPVTRTDPWVEFITAQTDEEAQQQMIDEDREIKGHLSKPLVGRMQFDAWANVEPGDSIMVPDSDGDVRMAGTVHERHRSGTTVRIWIDLAADPADVVRLLGKLTDWYRAGEVAAELADNLATF